MHVYLLKHPEEINQEQFDQMAALLPEDRYAKAIRYKFLIDRVLCAAAYLILCEGLKSCYGYEEIPEFIYGPAGKPELKNAPQIHFNFGHCKKGIICVLDEYEVGADIEVIPDKVNEHVIKHVFTSSEQELIGQAQNPAVEYIRLWTKKEAYLKYTGEGLSRDMVDVLNTSQAKSLTYDSAIYEVDGFVTTICHDRKSSCAEIHLINPSEIKNSLDI